MRRHAVVANEPLSQDKEMSDARGMGEAHLERCQAPEMLCSSANAARRPGCSFSEALSLRDHTSVIRRSQSMKSEVGRESLLHCHNVAWLGMRHSLQPRLHSEHQAGGQVCLTTRSHLYYDTY